MSRLLCPLLLLPLAHSPPALIAEKLPLLALSLATAAVTLAAQASKGATTMLHDQADLPVRLANAAIAYTKYLAMTSGRPIWPSIILTTSTLHRGRRPAPRCCFWP